MPESDRLVVNTSPIIALIAALGDLRVLQHLYSRVLVPFEVCEEILVENASRFAAQEFEASDWLEKLDRPTPLTPLLANSLDKGEASVIQLALVENIPTVCIDEAVGRRIARLSGLKLTGSIGILLKAKQQGYPVCITDAVYRMRSQGIRLSETVVQFALSQAGEV